MPLKVIRLEDQEKILLDASGNESIKRSLLMRGGHFESNPDLEWAIDRNLNSYIFSAPALPVTQEYRFCFCCNRGYIRDILCGLLKNCCLLYKNISFRASLAG